MTGQISTAEFLTMIRTARAQRERRVAQIPSAWLTEPGVAGAWSINDIIAHITWGERENIGVVRAHVVVGSALWQLSEDERNAAVFEQNRAVSGGSIERVQPGVRGVCGGGGVTLGSGVE